MLYRRMDIFTLWKDWIWLGKLANMLGLLTLGKTGTQSSSMFLTFAPGLMTCIWIIKSFLKGTPEKASFPAPVLGEPKGNCLRVANSWSKSVNKHSIKTPVCRNFGTFRVGASQPDSSTIPVTALTLDISEESFASTFHPRLSAQLPA